MSNTISQATMNAAMNTAMGSVINPNVVISDNTAARIYPGPVASPPRQMELWPRSELIVRIMRAQNGHVVQIHKNQGDVGSMWIVPEDQKLTDVIAAAIVASSLQAERGMA